MHAYIAASSPSDSKMQVHTSIFLLLWFLLCPCKCEPRHPAFGEETGNHSEEVHKDRGHRPSKYLLPLEGNETLPWSCCEHEACQYQDMLPYGILKCDGTGTLSVLNGYCVTIDEENILEAGHCLYRYNMQREILYTALPKNKSALIDFMCGMELDLHKTGTLCGKCQDGYYPLAYSYDMSVQMASLTGGNLCWLLFFH